MPFRVSGGACSVVLRAYPHGIRVYRDAAIVFYNIPAERITA